MRGKILSTIAGVYTVYLENLQTVNLKPRGKFRHLKIKPVVGDLVEVNEDSIIEIYPRSNLLIRPSISNLDLGIIVISMVQPIYSSYLLDKFLTMLNMMNVKPLIILSKIDMNEDVSLCDKIVAEYRTLGIKVIPFSNKTKENVELIREEIKGKTIAFMGQTGVGKSSLINVLIPELERKIGEYSKALNRGKHQTKEVIIFPYEDGYLADTPGFSSLELECYKDDLALYFPFIKENVENCFFNDCKHIKEPKCSIRKKVDDKIIPLEHYENYKDIFDELIFKKERFD